MIQRCFTLLSGFNRFWLTGLNGLKKKRFKTVFVFENNASLTSFYFFVFSLYIRCPPLVVQLPTRVFRNINCVSPKLLCWLHRNRGRPAIITWYITFSTSLLPALLSCLLSQTLLSTTNTLCVIYHAHVMHYSTLPPRPTLKSARYVLRRVQNSFLRHLRTYVHWC